MNNNHELYCEFLKYCENCNDTIEETWKKFVLADFESGINKILEIFNKLEVIINYADSLNKFEKDNYFNIQNLLLKLNSLEKAMSIPDYVLVADILKYEIQVCISEWLDKIKK